jgi:hypothetical protein
MNPVREVPIISSDAGDTIALQDPTSPASIMKKAKQQEAQSAADMKYDAQAPPAEGFENCVVEWEKPDTSNEIIHALFLASAVALLLYAAAPTSA